MRQSQFHPVALVAFNYFVMHGWIYFQFSYEFSVFFDSLLLDGGMPMIVTVDLFDVVPLLVAVGLFVLSRHAFRRLHLV